MLTYTLWYGTDASNITTRGVSSSPTKQGNSVTITQTELSMDTTYYFKVVVTDGTDENESGVNNAKTYCMGIFCKGGWFDYSNCSSCHGSGFVPCEFCNGNSTKVCTNCNRNWN